MYPQAQDINRILKGAQEMKENPENFTTKMAHETLYMLFSKPSLRTRLSFEAGMTQMGGHAIYYPLDKNATLGDKESIEDVARVVSRYCSVIMARVSSRKQVQAEGMLRDSTIMDG